MVTSEDVSFAEHIENVQSSKIMLGHLLRNFETRDLKLIKMVNAYIRSKIEYCKLVWSPWKKRYKSVGKNA